MERPQECHFRSLVACSKCSSAYVTNRERIVSCTAGLGALGLPLTDLEELVLLKTTAFQNGNPQCPSQFSVVLRVGVSVGPILNVGFQKAKLEHSLVVVEAILAEAWVRTRPWLRVTPRPLFRTKSKTSMDTCDGSHAAIVGTTASVSCPAGLRAKGHDLLLLSQHRRPTSTWEPEQGTRKENSEGGIDGNDLRQA